MCKSQQEMKKTWKKKESKAMLNRWTSTYKSNGNLKKDSIDFKPKNNNQSLAIIA